MNVVKGYVNDKFALINWSNKIYHLIPDGFEIVETVHGEIYLMNRTNTDKYLVSKRLLETDRVRETMETFFDWNTRKIYEYHE